MMRGYLCDHCPLAFEIGGYAFWELDGRLEQAVCRACGTMHRLTEWRGGCEVAALPGPVRSLPYVTRTAEWYASRYDPEILELIAKAGCTPWPAPGEESSNYEWPFTESDWEPVGTHPGGVVVLGHLTCARCGVAGRMQSLTFPPHPDGFWVSFRDVCPLCGRPMPFLYDMTVN